VKHLDLNSLKRDQDAYIDESLKEHFVDVLYTCNYGKSETLEIAFLFEHKSVPPQNSHLQILRYILQIWENRLRNKKPLQIILPIVVYHGQRKWRMRRFEDYFGEMGIPKELLEYVPSFEYLLVNLQAEDQGEIRKNYTLPELRMALLLMKFIQAPNIMEKLPLIFEEGKTLFQDEEQIGYLEAIALYLYRITKKPMYTTEQFIIDMIEGEPEEGTYAWHIKKEAKDKGIEEGREAGLEEGIALMVTRMLQNGFTIEEAARISKLSLEAVEKLNENLLRS